MLLIYLKQFTKIVVLNQLQLVEPDCVAMATNASLDKYVLNKSVKKTIEILTRNYYTITANCAAIRAENSWLIWMLSICLDIIFNGVHLLLMHLFPLTQAQRTVSLTKSVRLVSESYGNFYLLIGE